MELSSFVALAYGIALILMASFSAYMIWRDRLTAALLRERSSSS